jgi:hypothetical protein
MVIVTEELKNCDKNYNSKGNVDDDGKDDDGSHDKEMVDQIAN